MRYSTVISMLLVLFLSFSPSSYAVNGVILDQHLDASNRGYTILHVWGTHYEMGYAFADLMSDHMIVGINEMKAMLGTDYPAVRSAMDSAIWKPDEIEDELEGMVDALAVTHPAENIDKLDLKVANGFGDWAYGIACRSHSCWGSFVTPPVSTLSTRRLDYYDAFPSMHHHVLCAWDPDDGSPRWVGLAWTGYVVVITAVNEYGTQASLHDYSTGGSVPPSALPRTAACRYILTMPTGADISTHLADGYAELQNYNAFTGGFINHFTPDGHGGVITCSRAGGFYDVRLPQPSYFNGEVFVTANAWTDGTYTPTGAEFMADYYAAGGPKDLASHWDLMGTVGMHKMSVEYRGHEDMTIWVQGRVGTGVTPRLEWEWADLFSGGPGTIGVILSCSPSSGTVPFVVQFTIGLENRTDYIRRLAGSVAVTLAGGTFFDNWKTGYSNVAANDMLTTGLGQTIPALGSVIGNNVFDLSGEDVTPSPYNLPPYPPAGDTDTARCTVTATAP